MITVRTSPAYVNRVRQDWTANGGVYGDGGVYAVVPSNDPFAQLGPTLDLTFAGVPTDQFTAATTDGYSINLNLSSEIYQIAVEYAVWSGYQVNYALLPAALTEAALNTEPAKTLFKDTLIGGRPLGDINNDGSVTSADATAYQRFNGPFWLNTADRNDYIRTVLNPYMLANPGLYAAYLTPSTGLAQQTFAEIITFTRASTGTFFNSAGVLTAAAADQPRFDYDPSTLAAQGLLIEEQRTNSIRNNTMQGAVAGTPGTLPTNWTVTTSAGTTTNVVAVSSVAGITYVDLQVTTSGGNTTGTSYALAIEAASQIAALNGQTWTGSFWWSLVGGSFANVTAAFFDIVELDSGGSQVASGAISVSLPTSTFTRFPVTRTNSNAATAFVRPRFRFTVTNGVPVDFTFRIGLPQLENNNISTGVASATVASGGSGYAVGDVLQIVGGTASTAARLTVATLSGSAVATVTVSTAGSYSVFPSPQPVSVTAITGTGTSATFNIVPQSQTGFATSVIPTTVAAATRNRDEASVNTLSPWYNASEGTLFGESVSSVPSATLSGSIQPNIVYITDGTSNNRIGMFYNTGNVISGRIVTAGAATNPADRSANLPSVNRSALAYAVGTNQGALSVNGSAVTTSSPAGLPVVDRMSLGGGPVGISLNGYLRRITYYPRRLSNADLQTIAT